MTAVAVAVWDLTIPERMGSPTVIHKALGQLAKRFVFQLEEGKGDEEKPTEPDGESKEQKRAPAAAADVVPAYRHYQARMSLFKKVRAPQLRALLAKVGLQGAHYGPTSAAAAGGFSYVMKADSRVAGPWDDSTPELAEEPADLKGLALLPFQHSLIAYAKETAPTTQILCVVDPPGARGKSTVAKYLQFHQIAAFLPGVTDSQDMLASMMDRPPANCYFVDIPRTVDSKKLPSIWGAMETAKTGIVYDKRHHFKMRVQATPRLIVFCNSAPSLTWLTDGRLDMRMICHENKLLPWDAKLNATICTIIYKKREALKKKRKAAQVEDEDAKRIQAALDAVNKEEEEAKVAIAVRGV